jgi:hypothetical protein
MPWTMIRHDYGITGRLGLPIVGAFPSFSGPAINVNCRPGGALACMESLQKTCAEKPVPYQLPRKAKLSRVGGHARAGVRDN